MSRALFDLPTVGRRAMDRLDALKALSDDPVALTRLYLSPAHRRSVDLVARMMQEAGCDSVDVDPLGTVVGRYEGRGTGAKTLLIGSHIDTVKDAGAYDGTLGVVAGIAVVESLRAIEQRLSFAIEILAFGDEENVRFPSNLTSSRAVAGTLDRSCLDGKDDDGISYREALLGFGGDPDGIANIKRDPTTILGYLELHIEQGPVLEARGLPVGVVSAINGASRRRVTVSGFAGHAGTVPMGMRQDALAAAAEMVLAVERLASVDPATVGTVGRLTVEPGATNVIPGRVFFTLDLRGPDDAMRDKMVDAIEQTCVSIAERRNVGITIEPFYEAPACPCDPTMMAALETSIARHQITPLRLPSGAGHDAMAMADLCPVGMMFVRCKGGISHHPAESVTESDVDLAIRVLIDCVNRLDAKA
jgi:allantoate deiminase